MVIAVLLCKRYVWEQLTRHRVKFRDISARFMSKTSIQYLITVKMAKVT